MAKVTLDMETFKALASQTRLDVLRALDARRKTLSELAKELELNKATVHEHLQILLATGLVKKRDDEGRKWIYYELTWSGERLLHPEDTTTFAILLGLSTAAAGGGLAMLGRALEWWWAGQQTQGTPEGTPEADAADDGASESMVAADRASQNDTAEPSGSGSSQTSSSTNSETTQSGTQTTTESDTAGAPAAGDSTTTGDLAASSDGSTFLEDGGWLSLALFMTAVLLMTLAWVVRRGRRKKRQ